MKLPALCSVLVFTDVAMKKGYVSFNEIGTNDLLMAVSGKGTTAHVFSHTIDVGKNVVDHTHVPEVAKFQVSGNIGDLQRLNVYGLNEQGAIVKRYTASLSIFNCAPLRKYEHVLPYLEPWDTVVCYHPGKNLYKNWHVSRVVQEKGEARHASITDGSGLVGSEWLVSVTTKRSEVGFPSGFASGSTYLGLDAPISTPAYRLGRVSYKNYVCQCCGSLKSIQTNHEGSCWAYCDNCSWAPTMYGKAFYMNRTRPFLPFQLSSLVLRQGVEQGVATYADLTCMELARELHN